MHIYYLRKKETGPTANTDRVRHDLTGPDFAPTIRYVKTLIVGAAVLCLSAISPAQEVSRKDTVHPIVSSPLKVLRHFVGWAKDSLGKWVSEDNVLPYPFSAREGQAKIGIDNYKRLELRTVTIDGKNYPALVSIHSTLHYQYPALEMEPYYTDLCEVFVFHSWPKVIDDSRKDNESYIVKFTPYASGRSASSKEEEADKDAAEAVGNFMRLQESFDLDGEENEPHKGDQHTEFSMLVFPVNDEGKRSVRFLFYMNTTLKGTEGNWAKRSSIPFSDIHLDTKEFNDHYFEMPREEFIAFFGKDPLTLSPAGTGMARRRR